MRSLILLALLAPLAVSAQKFDVGMQCGISSSSNVVTESQLIGVSSQVRFMYLPVKHAAVTVFYEFDKWRNGEPGHIEGQTTCHAPGLSLDFVSRYFYVGVDGKIAFLKVNYTGQRMPEVSYKPSPGYGLHIGAKQKLAKRLSLTEQMGYEFLHTSGNITYKPHELPFAATGIGFNVYDPYNTHSFSGVVVNAYLRVGLSYRL